MGTARASPDPIYVLRGSKSPVSYLKFESNDTLYSSHYDGLVHIWSIDTKRIIHTVAAHASHTVLWLEFTQGCLITQGRNGSVKFWKRLESDWIEQDTLSAGNTGFCNCCLVDEKCIVVPSDTESTVDIWDITSKTTVGHLAVDAKQERAGMCMKIAKADGSKLLIGYEDGSIALWDYRQTGNAISRCKIHTDPVMCMTYDSVNCRGFSGSADEKIVSWDVQDGAINLKSSVTVTNPGFSDCLARQDGKLAAFSGWDSNIRLFSCKSLKPLAVLKCHKDSVYCLAFSDNMLLACGSKDEQISLWDIYR